MADGRPAGTQWNPQQSASASAATAAIGVLGAAFVLARSVPSGVLPEHGFRGFGMVIFHIRLESPLAVQWLRSGYLALFLRSSRSWSGYTLQTASMTDFSFPSASRS